MKNKEGNKGKQADPQEDFFGLLEEVQVTTTLTGEVREAYILSTLLHRGSNTHACNMGVSEPRVELNDHYKKFFYSGGKRPTMGIRDSKIRVKQAMSECLEYSSPL